VMSKLRPAGQTRPPERFYPARDMIPNHILLHNLSIINTA
jgi:hypothetical protein